jgi:hydroxyisourate hydrolase
MTTSEPASTAPAVPADPAELRELLTACLHVGRVADEVTARAPFADGAALLAAFREAAELDAGEVDEAMASHPRIGERPTGSGRAAAFSRREQGAAADADDEELAARLADGNARYEARTGRVFLIRAAGRSRAEILAELERRIELPADEETRIVASELRDIALLRLASAVGEPPPTLGGEQPTTPGSTRSRVTTHVLDAVTGRPAAGVAVTLERRDGDAWFPVADGTTDADGRVSRLGPDDVPAGRYRIAFDTGAWFAAAGRDAFYPEVSIVFEVADPAAHFHVPLLLSPFAYSTYRGS